MKRFAAVLTLLAIATSAFPCSIFKYSINGRTYFCGNEDWTATDPAIMTSKPKGNDYGYILLGWKSYLPRYVQAGVNSMGLCFDWAAVPSQRYVRDSAKDDLTLDFTVDVLRKCANVDEAVAFIRKYNIPHLGEEHIMFADSSGKSCVVEYNHSQMHLVVDQSEAQFITNFHLTDRSLGWYPCQRYARMETFFHELGSKKTRLVELLSRIHQEGQYPTVYSYVFDLSTRQITLFLNHNYQAKTVLSMDEMIESDRVLSLRF